VGLMNQAPT